MAIAQNVGTLFTAMLPAVFTLAAPPGTDNIPLIIGSITLVVTCIAAFAAYCAPETYRIPMQDLGTADAQAMTKESYDD
ncbi:MFS transporter, partial [Mycobacterium tuberculosis]